MIIQCPSCRFSGRIPSYALDSPHVAKCPKCHYRFELLGEPAIGMHAQPELHTDPGSSSYELKAITEVPEAYGDEEDQDLWENQESPADAGHDSKPALTTPSRASSTDAWPAPESIPRISWHTQADPWYCRVLQIWGVVFLFWAGVIVAHSLFISLGSEVVRDGHAGILSSVVSVLLLVPGAAALFLLVDLSRYIRGLLPTLPQAVAQPSPPTASLASAPPGRLWSRILHPGPQPGAEFKVAQLPAESTAV